LSALLVKAAPLRYTQSKSSLIRLFQLQKQNNKGELKKYMINILQNQKANIINIHHPDFS